MELESGKAPRALVWTEERVALWRDTGRRPSPVWHLVTHRGPRRNEAVHLCWADVDLEAAQATVREQTDEKKAWSPNSESGNRTIALDARTVEVLRALWDAQDAERRLWGDA